MHIHSTSTQYTRFVNDYYSTRYASFVAACLGLGVAAFGIGIIPGMAASIAGYVGLGISASTLEQLLSGRDNKNAIEAAIDQMEAHDGRGAVKVVTNCYKWTSGSGNHETTYAEIDEIRYLVNG